MRLSGGGRFRYTTEVKNIIKILRLSKPLYGLIAVLGVIIVTTALLNLIAPLLSKSIVDEIVKQIQTQNGNIQHLITLILIAFGSSLLSLILTSLTGRLGDHFAGRIRQFLTEKFYDKVLSLPQSYFNSELSGKLVNQLNRGILTIQGFMNGMTNFMLPTLLQSVIIIFILSRYSIPIAVFLACLFPVYLVISYYSTVQWGKEEMKKNIIEDKTRGRIAEVVLNMALVKSFTQEVREYATISSNLTDINSIYARQSRAFHIYDFFRGLSLQIILFGINIIVFYSAFSGSMSIGEMVLILQLVNQARIPLFAMSYILTQIQQAEAGSKEYFEILSLQSKENYKHRHTDAQRVKHPVITFRDVEFRYESSGVVLENVSLTLKSPESVALVGHSGAGKTTLISLLLKFYDPTKGILTLNGKPYQEYSHTTIRNNISLVFQDNELFSSTVRENVAYGKPDASDKEVIQALKLANAYDFVSKLPVGLESEIGERGVKLSGGQKQRIQIARAILKDAPILILDEATSSLDAKSEKEVQDGLDTLMQKKLVLIIAHRFSTIQNVDKVIVLDHGKIVDYGKPQELAKKPGVYSELLRYQIEGNKKLLEKYEIF